MRSLFDVNFLIALFDFDHPFHTAAISWWKINSKSGWASCPITENGVVRIMSHPNYRSDINYTVDEVITSLTEFSTNADHEFWPASLSFRDHSVFDLSKLRSSKLTDTYLLALAAENNGKLVTFDQNIDILGVKSADRRHLEVVELPE